LAIADAAPHLNITRLYRIGLAPKARSHASLGHRPRNSIAKVNEALKARFNPPGLCLIPNIALVEINAVLVQ
jgi:hypothetical protein